MAKNSIGMGTRGPFGAVCAVTLAITHKTGVHVPWHGEWRVLNFGWPAPAPCEPTIEGMNGLDGSEHTWSRS